MCYSRDQVIIDPWGWSQRQPIITSPSTAPLGKIQLHRYCWFQLCLNIVLREYNMVRNIHLRVWGFIRGNWNLKFYNPPPPAPILHGTREVVKFPACWHFHEWTPPHKWISHTYICILYSRNTMFKRSWNQLYIMQARYACMYYVRT